MILFYLLQAAFGIGFGIAMESVQSESVSEGKLQVNFARLILGSVGLLTYAYTASWIIERWSLSENQVLIGVVIAMIFCSKLILVASFLAALIHSAAPSRQPMEPWIYVMHHALFGLFAGVALEHLSRAARTAEFHLESWIWLIALLAYGTWFFDHVGWHVRNKSAETAWDGPATLALILMIGVGYLGGRAARSARQRKDK